MTRVKGVHGIKENVPVYPVQITLNNENVSLTLGVSECEQLTDDDAAEFLLGMDVINRGDFSITNLLGKTVMSFRVPSLQTIDFVAGIRSHIPQVADKIPSRNDPCGCGSGKKFKNCCGRNKP
ncbi:MAG: SEC-C domain-containing protein, partial [Bacteroidales bacterium]|nr:SEC-C domain-containing protein [Bacteroidales bacterium]